MSTFVQIAALALVLSASTVSATVPKTSNFLLLASDDFAPKFPTAGNPVVSHSAVYSRDFDGLHPGRHTQLDYTVEHSDNVLLLDNDQRVQKVLCTADEMSLFMTDSASTNDFLNNIVGDTKLVGHCISSTGSYGEQDSEVVFARQIISYQQSTDQLITLSTLTVDATAVYKHANVSFTTNSYGMFASDNNQCSVWDIIRGKCSAVVNETKNWDDLFNYDFSGKTIWSGSVGTNPQVDASVTCASCFAKLTPELVFNLQITDNKLANVEVLIQGNFAAEVEAVATASGSFQQSNAAVPVYTINAPDLAFYVGVFPIHVHFSVPITASYDVTLSAQGSAQTGISVTGDVGAGFGYEGGKWGPVFNEQFHYDVIKPTGQANGNGLVKVGLTPSFHLDIDLLASGKVDVAPYLEFDVEASSASTPAAFSAQAQLYAGVDVNVEGQVGLTFQGNSIGPHLSYGPKSVFTIRKQIWSGSYPPQQSATTVVAAKKVITL